MSGLGGRQLSLSVVHVAETIRGGIATYLREILPLQVRRFGVDRVAIIAPRTQLADLGKQPGVDIIPIEKANSRFATAWRVKQRLSKIAAEQSIDILHIHSAFAGMTCRGWLSAARYSRAIVYCPHGWAFKRLSRSALIAARIERALSRRCDAIVCVSHSEYDTALRAGLPNHKLTVIQNALPDKAITQNVADNLWRPGTLRLVFAGRFDRQKGFDVLLAALKRVDRDVELHVFGESVLGEYLASDVPANLHMHGWQNFQTMEPFIAGCHAVVMPSRWEGLSIAALETMRAAKPLIATRVGGLTEVVEDRVTGILTPPGDVCALADVLNVVKVDELAAMGVRARERFLARFLIDKCEHALANLYGEVVSREN